MEISIERYYFENILEVHAYLGREELEVYWDGPNEYLQVTATDPGYMAEHSTVWED
jgi:hypothetical protein